MLYTILQPSPPLRTIVKRYWMADIDVPLHESFAIQASASVHLGIIFLLGNSYQMKFPVGQPRTITESFITSHLTHSHLNILNSGRTVIFGVDFNHTALSNLLHLPMGNFTDNYISLESVLGKGAHTLNENLRQAQSPAGCVSIIEPFLLNLLSKNSPHKDYADYAVDLITTHAGNIGIQSIAKGLRISDRHLNRIFTEKVGINPKLYARLVRFSYVYKWLEKYPDKSCQDAIFRLGYYDQSHLIKDFVEFSGHPPSHYQQATLELNKFYLQS
jgi:AraC-like DNA-binding protein